MSIYVALEGSLPDLGGVDAWLYCGQDSVWRIEAEQGALAGLPRLDVADRLQQLARELRRPFLDWCATLGLRNDSVEWWASELAARTSYTLFYDRVCALAAALETTAACPDRTMLVVCPTPAFAETLGGTPAARASTRASGTRALRAWARIAPSSLLALPGTLDRARLLLDSDPRFRRRVLERHGAHERRPFTGTLLFTWVDGRSFAPDGTYADPHFGPLAEMLRGRGVDVAFVPRVLPGFSFADAVPRLLATGEAFLFPDAYLELDDHRACARHASEFAPVIDDDASVGGVPVALLAREHVESHRPSQAAALVLEPLLRRFAVAGIRPERMVHTCEGHGWELVLAWAARRHQPGTVVVGYDNLNMSTLALSMFSAPPELAIRPRPDLIVTNGPAYRDVLVREGLPESHVRSGCALRHAYLWDAAPQMRTESRQVRVLAATELALGPSAELVEKAAAAFADDDDYDLVVKAHPLQPRAEIVRILGSRATSLRFDERPTLELLAEADLLLYTYSAVGFEALALGVPPVFVHSESRLDLDQLEYAHQLRWEARTPSELRSAAEAIAVLDLADWRERARAAALAALAPPSRHCIEAFL